MKLSEKVKQINAGDYVLLSNLSGDTPSGKAHIYAIDDTGNIKAAYTEEEWERKRLLDRLDSIEAKLDKLLAGTT